MLQIDWGLESMELLDSAGGVIFVYGANQRDSRITSLAQQVTSNYRPATSIFCTDKCRIYAAVPVFFSSGETNIMVLGATLVDFIIEFSQQNNLGAALLRRQQESQAGNAQKVWGYSIAGINDKATFRSILTRLSREITVDAFIREGKSLQLGADEVFYLHAIDIDTEGGGFDNIIELFSDITEQRQTIYHDLIFATMYFFTGLMVTLLILLLVLQGPLARIRLQAKLLPLLAKSGFDTVRTEIAKRKYHRISHDELDVLEETAVSLSYQLELMEEEIQGRTTELEQMALYDVLTGLSNRRQFTEQLQSLIKDCEVYGERFAVAFIDLDNFKRVNDSLGHDAGDALLIEVSKRLTAGVRATDIVSRLGGDEFTLLLPQVGDIQNIVDIMEKTLRHFQYPMTVIGKEVTVTTSIGIAVGPDNGMNVQELMRCADMAMYQAKEDGKNRYHFFTEKMIENIQHLIRVENEINIGIDCSQFRLYYQPIIDLSTGKIVALEALLRWNHPQKGILPPADFINVLETNGQIVLLGPQIFEMACLDFRLLQCVGLGFLTISVNISAKQFNDAGLIEKFIRAF
jgi:diguanylate cyclase (GGDEF)-like protein